MLLGLTSPGFAPRIGTAREEKMLNWSKGIQPCFISWNVAALHTFEFAYPDVWSRKKVEAVPSRKHEVSAGHWNDLYSPAVG